VSASARRALAYLHFGDLHVTTEDRHNYRDFVALIADANDIDRPDLPSITWQQRRVLAPHRTFAKSPAHV